MPAPRAFRPVPIELTPLDRERLRRMATEIDLGVAMAEGSHPPPDIQATNAGAFGRREPPADHLRRSIDAAREDARFLRELAERGKSG